MTLRNKSGIMKWNIDTMNHIFYFIEKLYFKLQLKQLILFFLSKQPLLCDYDSLTTISTQ